MPPQPAGALPVPLCPTARPASAETPSCTGKDQEHPHTYQVLLRSVLVLDRSHCTLQELMVINLSTLSHCCESLVFSHRLCFIPVCPEKLQVDVR